MLGHPAVAALLGLIIGTGLFEVSRFGAGFFTAEDPWLGMARTLVINAASMGAALIALTLVFVFARSAVAPFGVALAGGFMCMALVALFRNTGPFKAPYARR